MSIVIIGGNECMKRRYIDTCRKYGCSAKVFLKNKGELRSKFGQADLFICFTRTTSHQMVHAASEEAKRSSAKVEHVESSSISALTKILENHTKLH